MHKNNISLQIRAFDILKHGLEELLESIWIHNGLLEKQFDLIQKRRARGLSITQGIHEVPGEGAQIHYAFVAFSVPLYPYTDLYGHGVTKRRSARC